MKGNTMEADDTPARDARARARAAKKLPAGKFELVAVGSWASAVHYLRPKSMRTICGRLVQSHWLRTKSSGFARATAWKGTGALCADCVRIKDSTAGR